MSVTQVRKRRDREKSVTHSQKSLYWWYDRIDDIRLKRAVDKRMERVAEGNYGDCESVGEGVLELRFLAFGARVYFAEVGEVLLLLPCAGNKSSQLNDIAKAKEYWRGFHSRAQEV